MSGQMKKILVVDDDVDIVQLIAAAFAPYAYEVLTAQSGTAALEVVRQHRPDLIILDLMMPDGHGFSVCQAVRADETLRQTRILVLSAKHYPADRQHAFDLGADEFMTKPFNVTHVVACARRLLEG